ncbi:MAG: hypothetical protein OEX82_05530 [Nitrosomonas sp.]|nr:hypothetical protein [Nitrosomonas sp.]
MDKNFLMFQVASDQAREKVFLEVSLGDRQFVEVSVEGEEPIIKFFNARAENGHEFEYAKMKEIISRIDNFIHSMGLRLPE